MDRLEEPFTVINLKECDIDHDHGDSWFCDTGGGVLHPAVIQRDIRALTAALEAVARYGIMGETDRRVDD